MLIYCAKGKEKDKEREGDLPSFFDEPRLFKKEKEREKIEKERKKEIRDYVNNYPIYTSRVNVNRYPFNGLFACHAFSNQIIIITKNSLLP